MKKIISSFHKHYSSTFKQFGATAKGVDWGTKEKANIRHEVMYELFKHETDEFSILDVGCGYGEFLKFMNLKQKKCRYKGIDVVEEMIDFGNQNFGKHFYCRDVFDLKKDERFDYLICNGILTQLLNNTYGEMDNLYRNLIQKMFEHATKGIAFNFTTSYVDFIKEENYYKNPIEILSYCFQLTNKVKLDHSYPLFEYTVYMYK